MKTTVRLLSGFTVLIVTASFCASFAQEMLLPPGEIESPAWEKRMQPETFGYTNWVELGFGWSFLSGDKAQFQKQQGIRSGPIGGIQDFHYSVPVGSNVTFTADGRAIFDNHDYFLRMELAKENLGFIRGGYREFPVYYDGSGGFFPNNGQWLQVIDDRLMVRRGDIFFEAGLLMPDVPSVTFRYSHEYRRGYKDSTSWGDTALIGLPTPAGGQPPRRAIVPSFLTLDEELDTFEVDVRHHIIGSDVGLGVRYQTMDNEDTRNIRRRPTERADRFVTQREEVQSDLFNVHAFSETRIHENVLFTTGYGYTRMWDSDFSGSRIYGGSYDPVYNPNFTRLQPFDEGFRDMSGSGTYNQHVANLNLFYTPHDTIAIVPTVRIEQQDRKAGSSYIETSTTGGPPLTEEPFTAQSDRDMLDVAEGLEVRYTGMTNWVYYVRGDWLEGNIDLRQRLTPIGEVPENDRHSDTDRFSQKYTAGVNWYPLRQANFAAQYYHKIYNTDMENQKFDTDEIRYPAFLTDQDFTTDDVNFRVTLRPLRNVTLVSRYDYQESRIYTTTEDTPAERSGLMTTHIFSEGISWAPIPKLYLNGNFQYVLDVTHTPAENLDFNLAGVVLTARNNYWMAGGGVGYSLDEKTDLQANYFYYRTDNFQTTSASVPYGAGADEHAVTAGLIRQLTQAIRWSLRYGFYTYNDETSGGHNDYQAHLLFSSITYRF